MESGGESFLTVECAEDERSESEGRFGEAEPVGCASIRERVETCRTVANCYCF